jgi:hypothetical protein
MSKLKVLIISLLFSPMLSYATVFDFSYVFQAGYGDDRGISPTTITGSFNGDQEGNYVTNLSDIKIAIQGREFLPNLVSVLYSPATGTPWDFSQEGQVSFDVMQNNFMFVNAEYANGGSLTNYFYITSDPAIMRQASNDNGGYSYGFDDNTLSNQSWKLSAREVPEPSGLLLLALGLIAVVLKRRSFQSSKH